MTSLPIHHLGGFSPVPETLREQDGRPELPPSFICSYEAGVMVGWVLSLHLLRPVAGRSLFLYVYHSICLLQASPWRRRVGGRYRKRAVWWWVGYNTIPASHGRCLRRSWSDVSRMPSAKTSRYVQYGLCLIFACEWEKYASLITVLSQYAWRLTRLRHIPCKHAISCQYRACTGPMLAASAQYRLGTGT